ncbi:MAG TPA: MmgE/PrpD family protein [Steroidobacteraceae bacterium]|nr:MmgE/PrpD family protein [Steroidobacteraceae bacterium]
MRRRDFGKLSFAALAATLADGAHVGTAAAAGGAGTCYPPFPDGKGLTAYVAEFVTRTPYEAIPAQVIELGKKSILDGLGLALAGQRAESGPIMLRYLDGLGCKGSSTIIGTGRTAAPQFAALINSVAIHAEDFDDTQLSAEKSKTYGLLMHPTAPVLPAALVLAERQGSSGKELMLAYHLGVEVECKIAEAMAPRAYEEGFHTSALCGPFGSASACARLRGLDTRTTRIALGIAASTSGGLREEFGTMTKPLQVGHGAEDGYSSVELAALGWTAADNILEAERGFMRAVAGTFDLKSISGKLGAPWTFAWPGVSIKPYPSGSLTHPAMTEMANLIRKHDIKPERVTQVQIGASANNVQTLLYHDPKTGLQGKFSMEFCMAILLLERKAGLVEFQDAVVNRPDVRQMMKKVRFYVDPQAQAAGNDKMMSIIRITLQDGSVITGQSSFGKGSPANPMSYEEVADKFRGCAEFARWPAKKTAAIVQFVRTLEAQTDMRRLTALLRA